LCETITHDHVLLPVHHRESRNLHDERSLLIEPEGAERNVLAIVILRAEKFKGKKNEISLLFVASATFVPEFQGDACGHQPG
jgi:hypothetical protein